MKQGDNSGTFADLLVGGDRRTIGRADEVVAMVTANPNLFPQLIDALWHDDELVRMRAADAAEKVTRSHPKLLENYKRELLSLLAETTQPELRWHLAVIVPRIHLERDERQLVVAALQEYLRDRSSIVKTFALQGMADLARHDASLLPSVVDLLQQATRNGTPAMKARSRKLLLELLRSNSQPSSRK